MSSSPEAPAEAGRVFQQSAGGYPQAADASLVRASQQSGAEAGRVSQQSAAENAQAVDASLAQTSRQSGGGSLVADPVSVDALRASQGAVQGADTRVSTASDAGARASQSGAEPGRDSQMCAGGAMAAPEEVGRVSRHPAACRRISAGSGHIACSSLAAKRR